MARILGGVFNIKRCCENILLLDPLKLPPSLRTSPYCVLDMPQIYTAGPHLLSWVDFVTSSETTGDTSDFTIACFIQTGVKFLQHPFNVTRK